MTTNNNLKELFSVCLKHSVLAADYADYSESGISMFMDYLKEQGFDPQVIESYLLVNGAASAAAASAYMDCFQEFGVMSEYEDFSCVPQNFQNAMKEAADEMVAELSSIPGTYDKTE